jgi:hypothetical protein
MQLWRSFRPSTTSMVSRLGSTPACTTSTTSSKGSIDIAQPSVTKIGGITEMRKIVALAEAKFGPALRLFLARQPRLDPHCRCAGDRHPAGEHLRQPGGQFVRRCHAGQGRQGAGTDGTRPRRRARHGRHRVVPPRPGWLRSLTAIPVRSRIDGRGSGLLDRGELWRAVPLPLRRKVHTPPAAKSTH